MSFNPIMIFTGKIITVRDSAKVTSGSVPFNPTPTTNPQVPAMGEGEYLPTIWGEILAFADEDRELMRQAKGKVITVFGYFEVLEPYTGYGLAATDKDGNPKDQPWGGVKFKILPVNVTKLPTVLADLGLTSAFKADWYTPARRTQPAAPAPRSQPAAGRGTPPAQTRGRSNGYPPAQTAAARPASRQKPTWDEPEDDGDIEW